MQNQPRMNAAKKSSAFLKKSTSFIWLCLILSHLTMGNSNSNLIIVSKINNGHLPLTPETSAFHITFKTSISVSKTLQLQS